MPNCEPSPSSRSKFGRFVGVEMMRMSRMLRHHEHRQRVVDHRLVVDGQKLLARHGGQRVQPRARAARQHYSLHGIPPICSDGFSHRFIVRETREGAYRERPNSEYTERARASGLSFSFVLRRKPTAKNSANDYDDQHA